MRSWQALTALLLVSSLLTGCGCETYRSYVRAEGVGYPRSDPDRSTKVEMDWDDTVDEAFLDATPRPGVSASFCLSAEPDAITDAILVLDYGLELGARQTGVAGYYVTCHIAGPTSDPMVKTWVVGHIDVGGVTVELDRIEAVSTSLQPPRYDVILGGQGDDGVEYEFDLELKAERTGNAINCD